jgi:poly-gamma-glutamate synthesis protein (capsule biosynthesis protein)
VPSPLPHVRRAAAELRDAGATLVAGHSAHVFHGAGDRVLYDLGDFIDDYAVDPELRNDLGLLFVVTFVHDRARRVEAVPLALEYCFTRLAAADDRDWIVRRFRAACAAFGTETTVVGDRVVIEWEEGAP